MAETLDSLLNQDYEAWECIIVDDGSTDSTIEIAKNFEKQDGRFRIINRTETLPKGANSCRNLGAKLAKGELLLFLDADDLLSNNCLSYRTSQIGEQIDLAVFHTGNFTVSTEESTAFSNLLNPSFSRVEYLDLFLDYQIPWHTSSGLWGKDFFTQIGGFDMDLQRFQDVDLHIRALNSEKIRLWVDGNDNFTSFYRKSTFHTHISLERRRFVLDQGILFLKKLKSEGVLSRAQGLLLYLMFRFEEVLKGNDVKHLRNLFEGTNEILPVEVKMMFSLEGKLIKSPSRIRKVLSFGIYKLYKK